jgi:type IV secretion system protein VirB10
MTSVSSAFKVGAVGLAAVVVAIMVVFGGWGEDEIVRKDEPDQTRDATDGILSGTLGLSDGANDGVVVGQNSPNAVNPSTSASGPASEAPIGLTPQEVVRQDIELKRLTQILEADLAEEMATRELRKQAMRSPIGASQVVLTGPASTDNQNQVISAQTSALQGISPSLILASQSLVPSTVRETAQPELLRVAATPSTDVGYSKHRRAYARSPYEIKKGTIIPGTLITEINSDIPGNVVGMVRLDVYDTVTGQHLLIPSGSRLFGVYDPSVDYAQKRLNIVWTHMIFPNGDTLVLEDQQATDVKGSAGFADKRKGNFLANLGGNLLYSILGAGENAAQKRLEQKITGTSDSDENSIGQSIAGLGNQLGGGGTTTAASVFNNKQGTLRPTLKIRSGYRFNILVSKDIILEP